MENRFICRVCEKIGIGNDIYVLKTIGYENDAEFDENDNLIMTDKRHKMKKEKLIPFVLNEDFLKSEETICYADDVEYLTLSQMTDEQNIEKIFEKYTDELEKYVSIVYFDEKLGKYDILKMSNEELVEFSEFFELKNLMEFYQVQNLQPIYISGENVTMGLDVYNKLINYANNDDIDSLKSLLTPERQITMNTEDGVVSSYYCNLIDSSKIEENVKVKTEEEIIKELMTLIGLDKIKLSIKQLKNYLKFSEKTKNYLEINRSNLNMVFTGNPGTGKTTVAKIMSSLLNKMGLINDKIFECTAKDFIGQYVGHTAIKAHDLIQKAKGGILFIDEAYSFVSQGNSFAQEALAEILKEIEKKETIFIFSGYKKEMELFIKFNPGLESRIGYYFDFEDYTIEQLYRMFENKISKTKMILSEECKPLILDLIEKGVKYENFGNGRFIDNLFDKILFQHANNTVDVNEKDKLITITKEDIDENILEQIFYKEEQKLLGFRK